MSNKPNYHQMYIESMRDIKDANIVVYSEVPINNVSDIVTKLLNQVKLKYRKVIVTSNINIECDDIILIKEVKPLFQLITPILYRENARFIGFMKTKSYSYSELISYLKCANVPYRIYDITNQKWIIGQGDEHYV